VAGSGPHCRALASSSERDLLQVTTAEAFPGEQVFLGIVDYLVSSRY
jgi:hypothetical protein